MRILFLTHDSLDYVSDPLYVGLSRVLGHEQVVDYPYKRSFHDPEARLWCLAQRPGRRCSREEIVDLLRGRAFDLVCLASFRRESIDECAWLYGQVPFPPMVFVDGEDGANLRHDVVRRFPLAAYFKREYVWTGKTQGGRFLDCVRSFHFDKALYAKTHPFPMSVDLTTVPQQDVTGRDVDVSFYGHASHRKRLKAMGVLESLDAEGLRVSGDIYGSATDRKYKLQKSLVGRLMTKLFDSSYVSEADVKRRLSPQDHYRILARSKVALAVRGGGFDTYRYWEIVACKALLLAEMPDIVIPHNFEHGRHAVFCRPDLGDLKELVRYYSRHDKERETIAAEGYAHLLKYHTCERRAEYFLDVCAKSI